MAGDDRCMIYTLVGIFIFCLVASFIDDSGSTFSDMIDGVDNFVTLRFKSGTGTCGSSNSGKSGCSKCSDPGSRASCCSCNEIIQSQNQTLRSAGGCLCPGKRYGVECACIPNVGSMYLGATVISTRNTVRYKHPMGTEESDRTNKPSLLIEPSPVMVGNNWHFVGKGFVIIRLFYPTQISGFSVVHPPPCQLPRGFETAAPNNFIVQGMNKLDEDVPFVFGNYTYDIKGSEVQVFPVQNCSQKKYQLIEFQFLSNHGHPDYTSVYKVRIHGDVEPPSELSKNASEPESASGARSDEFDDTITAF